MNEKELWKKFANFITRNPIAIFAAVLLYTATLATQVPKIKVDLGLGVLYDEKDPGLQKLNQCTTYLVTTRLQLF